MWGTQVSQITFPTGTRGVSVPARLRSGMWSLASRTNHLLLGRECLAHHGAQRVGERCVRPLVVAVEAGVELIEVEQRRVGPGTIRCATGIPADAADADGPPPPGKRGLELADGGGQIGGIGRRLLRVRTGPPMARIHGHLPSLAPDSDGPTKGPCGEIHSVAFTADISPIRLCKNLRTQPTT